MRQSRRSFLCTSAALAFGAVLPDLGRGEEKAPQRNPCVNENLRRIAAVLRQSDVVASVDEHLVCHPTVGLTQWRWAHFRNDLDQSQLPQVEQVNAQLLRAMRTVHELDGAGMDSVLHEGFVEGRVAETLRGYRDIHRDLIRTQFTKVVPFGVQEIIPSESKVTAEMNRAENLVRPVSQIVYPNVGGRRNVRASPLARLGAPYVLSLETELSLLPAEDPELDRRAEQAERSGTAEEFQLHVITNRDRHFIKIVRESRRAMVHLLVGYDHVLADDVVESNAVNDAKISHLVVTVKGVADGAQAK